MTKRPVGLMYNTVFLSKKPLGSRVGMMSLLFEEIHEILVGDLLSVLVARTTASIWWGLPCR